ncbi:type II secretion system F family protein [Halomonas dongshanensis]|uniref:Type II secretion system F family protein n=1 Tax=Halomonas dongshanensis TaxID=2890835 RepID=A0ABT2EGS0_9GAMM|nr:type II secretion system F family protein [Halomonas dongshanensis]MCS2610786.1 type II secretion system F family protein [Halomonas dongshanensis]
MTLLGLSALLLLAAGGLLFWAVLKRQRDSLLVAQRITLEAPSTLAQERRKGVWLGLGRLDGKLDAEVPRLLDQLGWRSTEQRARFYALQIGVPLLALGAAALVGMALSGSPSPLMMLVAGGIGFLLPKRWLRGAVKKRQARIADEVSSMLPLMRMLFEVGMTVEQSLRALALEGQDILPELSIEFRRVLGRVDVGLDLATELTSMAERLDIDTLTDCVVILEQLIRQGGGAVASLISLKELFDDRRVTGLQEKVSKLSAKMSGTMVAFLFPALLIILAGPGFIAIFRALSGMNQ